MSKISPLWLVRRILLAIFVVYGAATAAFVGSHLLPGNPVQILLGPITASPAHIAEIRHQLGLNQPLAVQYGLFLGRLTRGDLGMSYQLDEPVWHLIESQIAATAELALASLVLAFAVAVFLALATAGRRPALRRVSSTLELVTASTPSFWVGVLLLSFFSFRLHLFPAVGGSGLAGLVLPTITLALSMVGVFTQVLREGLERALDEPFVLSARSRGTSETAVRLRHAFRHALIPMITLSGWAVGALLNGAIVIETIFSRPGIGRLMASAVSSRDMPLITGLVVVGAASFSIINVAADLLYTVVDARLGDAPQ